MQNLFDQHDATKMFLNLISDSKLHVFDEYTFHAILKFAVKLLEGGNLRVQKTCLNYFFNYPRSEVLFTKIDQFFHDYIEELKISKKRELIKIVRVFNQPVTINHKTIYDEASVKENP